MKTSGGPLYKVQVETDHAFGDIVETGLELSGISTVLWRDEERDRCVFEEFFESRRQAYERRRQVAGLVKSWARGERWRIAVVTLAPEDWRESWKKHFRVEHVSRRIVIKPTWKTCRLRRGERVVELDPGMSFGTGRHPTTRGCIRFIDELAGARRGGRLLDLGCGSGILAIAAAKLGFARVDGVDSDGDAVAIARGNVRANAVAGIVSLRAGDVADLRPRVRYDVVVANILAGVLIAHASRITACVVGHPHARLVLSGILRSQSRAVAHAYSACGMEVVAIRRSGEWATLCLRRRCS